MVAVAPVGAGAYLTETSSGVGAAAGAVVVTWTVVVAVSGGADFAGAAFVCALTGDGVASNAAIAARRKRRVLMVTFLVVLAW